MSSELDELLGTIERLTAECRCSASIGDRATLHVAAQDLAQYGARLAGAVPAGAPEVGGVATLPTHFTLVALGMAVVANETLGRARELLGELRHVPTPPINTVLLVLHQALAQCSHAINRLSDAQALLAPTSERS